MADSSSSKSEKQKKVRVLWVEGRWKSNSDFVPTLERKGFKVEIATTGKEAIERVSKKSPDMVIVDAASMRTSGKRICSSIRDKVNGMPIMLIRQENENGDKELDCASTVLYLPFTSRKLVNRIKPLVPASEGAVEELGPIKLNESQHYVVCNSRKTSLTPRLIHLLKMLMEKPGEVLEREHLFKTVWNTDYTGDTRTLDVHISWLRQAIEKDPKKPKILKTIRGVGYRLDIPKPTPAKTVKKTEPKEKVAPKATPKASPKAKTPTKKK